MPASNNPKNDWSHALKIFINLSYWIAFPVLIGTFLGRWLDRRYGTEPWLFLSVLGFCFLVSMYGLITKALKEFKKIDEEYKSKLDQRAEKTSDDNYKEQN
ncbi:MAG: AtpZ/AtpI family protein [Patescibacteria group bacterium]